MLATHEDLDVEQKTFEQPEDKDKQHVNWGFLELTKLQQLQICKLSMKSGVDAGVKCNKNTVKAFERYLQEEIAKSC